MMPIRIRSSQHLRELLQARSFHFLPAKRVRIVVELPGVPPSERERLSAILTKQFSECGCSHGAAFLLVGVFMVAVDLIVFGLRPFGLWYVALAPLFIIGLAGFGKALGICWARMRFRSSLRHLLSAVERERDETLRLLPSREDPGRVPTHV